MSISPFPKNSVIGMENRIWREDSSSLSSTQMDSSLLLEHDCQQSKGSLGLNQTLPTFTKQTVEDKTL